MEGLVNGMSFAGFGPTTGPQGPAGADGIGTPGATGPTGPAPTAMTPALVASLNAANVARSAFGETSGTRFWSTDAKSCTGGVVYWKSAGGSETLTITLWRVSDGAQLAQKTVVTSSTGIVSVTWDVPISIAANTLYVIGVSCTGQRCLFNAVSAGFASGEYADVGVSYSCAWQNNSLNTMPGTISGSSPPSKSTVGPVLVIP